MFNFFRRKKSQSGEEKKKRGSQKDRKKGDESKRGQQEVRREAIEARSVREAESTGQTLGAGVLPNPSVVGPPSPGPIVMGNDYSQPLDASSALQDLSQIPSVDSPKKEIGRQSPQRVPTTVRQHETESDKVTTKRATKNFENLNETKHNEVVTSGKKTSEGSSTSLSATKPINHVNSANPIITKNDSNRTSQQQEFAINGTKIGEKPSTVLSEANPTNKQNIKTVFSYNRSFDDSKQHQSLTDLPKSDDELSSKVQHTDKCVIEIKPSDKSTQVSNSVKQCEGVTITCVEPSVDVPNSVKQCEGVTITCVEPSFDVPNIDNSILERSAVIPSTRFDVPKPVQCESRCTNVLEKSEHVDVKNTEAAIFINEQLVDDIKIEVNGNDLPNFDELCPQENTKSDSEFENNGTSLANEIKDEKSVTDSVGDCLARSGQVASCVEYSSGNSPESRSDHSQASSIDATTTLGEEMHRVGTYTQCLKGGLTCVEKYDGLKNGASENVCGLETSGQLAKSVGEINLYKSQGCDETNKSESDETSEEDESSECEDSDSDNVIKNDSGCWDERDGSIFLSESDNQVTTTASLSSLSSILRDGSFREKKHVKWADIDGKKDLTQEKENDDTFVAESSSEEEETEDEEEDGEETSDSEDTESGEEEQDQKEGIVSEEGKMAVSETDNNYKREDTWLDMKSSSSEESEEDEEEENEEKEAPVAVKVEEPKKEESSESEEDSSEEESSEDEQVKEEEPKTLKIDISEMHNRIAELQKDVNMKATNIDRLQVELDAACNESELVRQRFKRLEADLEAYKQTNKELLERIQVTDHVEVEKVNKSNKQLEAAERRIQQLETELERVKSEYSNLQSNYKKLQADRDMEVQIIQKALEKALTGQEEMEAKYEQEFEKLRTLNSSREVQMLEDFEWKLREVEKNCKKKMQEYENEFEKRSYELANQLTAAQADLEQISHLKLCEIELNQLKQTSSEQRKNLRTVNRKLEELQVSEKILQEEVSSLRSSLDKERAHVVALQAMHKDELADKEKKMRIKLELQIKQLTNEWEERLRKENNKIKTDLERISREEKIVAVDVANRLKDKEITQLKQNWEKKSQEFKDEIEKYKSKIANIEEQRRSDLDKAQTNSDREIFDLRRKMDKLDMSYQEKIEKIQEQHEAELAAVREDCDKRVQQSEANLQLQIGNSRATLELVKQQLRNEAQARIEKLEYEYQQKLEQQWNALKREKDSAIELLEEKHQKALDTIYKEIEKTKKQGRNEQDSLTRKRSQPPTNQPMKQAVPQQKNINVDNDSGHSPNHIRRLDVADVAEEIRTQGKEEVLQRSIEQLTRQLNAGKMEIEKLRQQLEVRENRQQQQQQNQQQKNAQHPVANPRRNKKGRSGRN